MELRSPKAMVDAVTGATEDKKSRAFALKSKSTMNGAFFGGGAGFLIGLHKKKNVYVYALVGALVGGFVSNILTVRK